MKFKGEFFLKFFFFFFYSKVITKLLEFMLEGPEPRTIFSLTLTLLVGYFIFVSNLVSCSNIFFWLVHSHGVMVKKITIAKTYNKEICQV